MEITRSRLLSLVVAVINGVIVFHLNPVDPGMGSLAGNYLVAFGPLVLIWFSDILGEITGPKGIDMKTPGWMIAGVGWILLLGPIAIVILYQLHKGRAS
jgi:hypothetical protein